MTDARRSVLIVDDEFSVRDSLSRWMTKDGFDAVPAESAEAAMAIAKQRRFDAAVVDIRMPGTDGLDLQRSLRALDPDLEVVIITAFATVENAVRRVRVAFELIEKLGRNDLCPCGSGRSF